MPWNQSSSDISSIFTGTLPLNQFGGYLAWLQPEPGNGVISHILCREPTGKSFTATNGTDGMPFGGHNTVPTRDQSQNGNPKPPNKFIVQKNLFHPSFPVLKIPECTWLSLNFEQKWSRYRSGMACLKCRSSTQPSLVSSYFIPAYLPHKMEYHAYYIYIYNYIKLLSYYRKRLRKKVT